MPVYGVPMVCQPSLFQKVCFKLTLLQWCQRMNTCFSNRSVSLFIKSNCDMFQSMPHKQVAVAIKIPTSYEVEDSCP